MFFNQTYLHFPCICRAINYEEIEEAIKIELKHIKPIVLESTHTKFVTEGLADCVESLQICEIEDVKENDDIQLVFNMVWFFY